MFPPSGVCRNSQGTLDTDKLFTGQRLDDTGLYYYNARYYDATIGRFISADTIVPNPANPQTLNRYSYCLNNPLKYTDPSGHLNPEDYPASEGWEPVYDNGGDVWGYTRGDMNVAIWAYTHPSVFYGGMGGFDRDYFYASLTGPQESYMDVFHVLLDVLGLIPVFGEPADGLNGVLYAIEGDWTNAGISTAAMIPFFGWGATAGKWGMRAYRWYDSATLAKHFTKHGADFGASTADEYANMAGDFLRRAQAERLPTKVDSSGIIRVYDPPTNTFGVYNPDGMTVTFFKPDPNVHKLPTNMDYWNSQPGVSP